MMAEAQMMKDKAEELMGLAESKANKLADNLDHKASDVGAAVRNKGEAFKSAM